PREAAPEREAERQDAAGRFLRELADVTDIRAEDLRAERHVPIEHERFGEAERISLGARSRLQRHREALAAAQEIGGLKRQLTEHTFEFGDPRAKRQLIAVLLF